MIRNLTIRNRDSHRSRFVNFLFMVKELVDSDRRFGFCMKNCIYGQLEMSRIPNFDDKQPTTQGGDFCSFLCLCVCFVFFTLEIEYSLLFYSLTFLVFCS